MSRGTLGNYLPSAPLPASVGSEPQPIRGSLPGTQGWSQERSVGCSACCFPGQVEELLGSWLVEAQRERWSALILFRESLDGGGDLVSRP